MIVKEVRLEDKGKSLKLALKRFGRIAALLWEKPLGAFIISLLIYALLSSAFLRESPFALSDSPYYNYMAQAFNHGQLDFYSIPPNTHDLIIYNNKIYGYWPPFPAFLLMPLVALFGVGFSDIFITWFLGAINVALVALLLRKARLRQVISLSPVQCGLLTAFFALGSVQLIVAPLGRVWFTGQMVGVLCVALAYLAVLSLEGPAAFFLLGVALAGALGTRVQMVFAGIWPVWYLIRSHWVGGLRRLTGWLLLAALPILLMGAGLLYLNFARFGSPLDFGLDYHNMAMLFRDDYARYGAFNIHYLPINFYYQYINYPFPWRIDSPMGGSLFLLSPLFFAAIWSLWQDRRSGSTWVIAATIAVVNIPILLLMGTGWVQFGPRYTLDFTIPLLLLTAQGMRRWRNSVVALLILISMLHYFAGFLFLFSMM